MTSWRSEAACLGVAPSVFYPPRGDSGAAAVAMTICRSCVVCAECLDDALEHEAVPRFGIVGGATARRRNELARHRRLATAGPIDELEAVETIVSTITAEPVVVRMRLAYAAAL